MKKILESELLTLAHNILKLKGKEDVEKMYFEAQKLYEKLSILRFYEKNINIVSDEISAEKIENTLLHVTSENDTNNNTNNLEVKEVIVENQVTEKNIEPEIEINIDEKEDVKIDEEILVENEKIVIDIDEIFEKKLDDIPQINENINFDEEIVVEVEKEDVKIDEEIVVENEKIVIDINEIFEKKLDDIPQINENEIVVEETNAPKDIKIQEEVNVEDETKTITEVKVEEVSTENKKHSKIEDYLNDNYDDLDFVVKKKLSKDIENTSTSSNIEDTQDLNLFSETKNTEVDEVKVENIQDNTKSEDLDLIKKIVEEAQQKVEAIKSERSLSINDTLSKGINIGLNDRIGFVKHLFNGSNEDYNRVISQLATIQTFEEAHLFINIHVKPDYNKWEGKEEYEMRFLNLIEKKYI